jgi:hypothetical protein
LRRDALTKLLNSMQAPFLHTCHSPALDHVPMQFLPSVTELVVAQCYYLDFDDRNRQRPIYVYLNSTGCINDQVSTSEGALRSLPWVLLF